MDREGVGITSVGKGRPVSDHQIGHCQLSVCVVIASKFSRLKDERKLYSMTWPKIDYGLSIYGMLLSKYSTATSIASISLCCHGYG